MDILITENIRLELTNVNQADHLFNQIEKNRSLLAEFLPRVPNMQSVQDLEEYLRNSAIFCQQGKEASFAILLNEIPVGRIGLHHINIQNKNGAIGYWLSKDAQGQGIMLRSVKALINYAFKDLGLHRIEIKAAVNNLKSQAIPVKLNFVKEGLLRQAEFVNNQFIDLFLYSMISDEWQN